MKNKYLVKLTDNAYVDYCDCLYTLEEMLNNLSEAFDDKNKCVEIAKKYGGSVVIVGLIEVNIDEEV